MIRIKTDFQYGFKSVFSTKTGKYIRLGILDGDKDTGVDPFMSSFPELIDIGIMGHCIHGLSGKCKQTGVQCYQHGDISKSPNMTFDQYKSIIDQCKNYVFQVALGGCGDPNKHEDFEQILRYTSSLGIVPNYTTSGYDFSFQDAYLSHNAGVGAVAVSWYGKDYTLEAIDELIFHRVKTNVHYVLSNDSIDEAIRLLRTNGFPKGINAVVFLLHKPVGLGQQDNVLKPDDPRLAEFLNIVNTYKGPYKLGFDSCCVPALLTRTPSVDAKYLDTCEAARWSMYISSDLVAMPCSFDNQDRKYAVDLKDGTTIKQAWESSGFESFRNKFRTSCQGCSKQQLCLGGCPLMHEINLCPDKTKFF